jgi:hypothetical protein
MRFGALLILSLAAAACSAGTAPRSEVAARCGIPESRSRSCTITLSGALNDTWSCSVDPVFDSSNNEFLLRLGVESSNPARVGGPVSIAVGFRGEPRIATYRNTDPGAKSAMFAYSSSYLGEWSEAVAGPVAPQGNHTLTIAKVGTAYCLSQNKAYPQMQGSLHATLPASASSEASGKVIVRATF